MPELADTLDASATLEELGIAAAKHQERMASRKAERELLLLTEPFSNNSTFPMKPRK